MPNLFIHSFIILSLLLGISSCSKEKKPPNIACRVSKVYVDGQKQQEFTYNSKNFVASIKFYFPDYEGINIVPKLYDEYIFEYDQNDLLLGYRSRFSPNSTNLFFKHQNNLMVGFERKKNDRVSKATLTYNDQKKIKTLEITDADSSKTYHEYEYYEDGNLKTFRKKTVSTYGTTTSLDFYSEYDNLPSPYSNQNFLLAAFLANPYYQQTVEPVSPNNPSLKIGKFKDRFESNSETKFVIKLNDFRYPKTIVNNINQDTYYSSQFVIDYEYENCK
jgi:hypothetical protein